MSPRLLYWLNALTCSNHIWSPGFSQSLDLHELDASRLTHSGDLVRRSRIWISWASVLLWKCLFLWFIALKGWGIGGKGRAEKCLRIKMTLKETNEAKSKGQRNDNEVLCSLKWGDIGAAKSKERCIRRTQCQYEEHLTCRAGRPLGGHHACWSVMCPMETLQTLRKRQGMLWGGCVQ